jgi:hypothetical protein
VSPGQIVVLVIPALFEAERAQLLPRSRLELRSSDDLIQRVQHELEARAPLGCLIKVRAPAYRRVRVQADLWPTQPISRPERQQIEAQADALLYRLINPVTGADGDGWPFERRLNDWEVANALRSLPGVAAVKVNLYLVGEDDRPQEEPAAWIDLDRDQMICSAEHDVGVLAVAPTERPPDGE